MTQTLSNLVVSYLVGAVCLIPSLSSAEPNLSFVRGSEAALDDKGGAEKKQKHYAVEVLVLHATNSKQGIDKRIGPMPELKKPPFSSYDSYKLLAKTRMKLSSEAPKRYTLPNKRILQTRLLEVLAGDFVRISASINQPKGRDFLPLLQVKAKVGQTFIVAGQSYNGGILVLVFRVVHA